MKKLEENEFVKDVIADFMNNSTLAIGAFGSSAYCLNKGSDVDMYILAKDKQSRIVTERNGYVFEIYHTDPHVVESAIESGDIRMIARMRSSRPLYDPHKIYRELIDKAKRKNLRYAEWIEKTIIGGKYDMVERTEESVEKALRAGQPIAAASSLRYLVDRIIDVGFRRIDCVDQANPRNIPKLVGLLPEPMQRIYEGTFKCAENYQLKVLMQLVKNEKEKLFPQSK